MKELIDVQKTRRRTEDVLRKSNQETIVQVANLLGVEIAKWERIPESEIFLADLWEELEGERREYKLVTLDDTTDDTVLTPQGRKILKFLPVRFETYSIRHGNKGKTIWRDFLTLDAAEEYKEELKKQGPYAFINMESYPYKNIKKFSIRKIPRNVVQMRMCLRAIIEEHMSHLKPDEKEVFKQLKQVLLK